MQDDDEALRREEKRNTGIYDKYMVVRADREDRPGYKHFGCSLFVLDLTHDPHAIPAIRAYVESCRDEYPVLARDLENLIRAKEELSATDQGKEKA